MLARNTARNANARKRGRKTLYVSGTIVQRIEPEPMDTSPTSRAFGFMSRLSAERPRQWEAPLPRGRLPSKKSAIYNQGVVEKTLGYTYAVFFPEPASEDLPTSNCLIWKV